VHVFNHKTIATSGPAVLAFSNSLFQEAEHYLYHLRNQVEGVDDRKDAPFFICWSGKRLASHMVTSQLNSFWGKAVGHTDERPRFNATLVRKSAVTKVHNLKPELKKDLALLMCHSEQTAKKSYYLQEKTKNACRTSTTLRTLLRTSEVPTENCNDKIRQIFHDCIEKGKITLTIVRERREQCKHEALEELSDVQLRDKIRYLFSEKENGR